MWQITTEKEMRVYDEEEAAELNAERWQLDLLNLNPSYVHWGPHEDYMWKEKEGWDGRVINDTWADFGPWPLDEYNECVNFYFSVIRDSKDCPTCGGNGLVTVWRDPSGPVVDVILATQAAYCDDCPLGKLIEETHRLKAPDVRKRMSWRSTLLANGWLPHPPGLDDRHVAAHRHFTAAELVKAWTAPAPPPQPDNS